VLGPSGHADGGTVAEDVAGAVDVKHRVPGKHLEVLVLMRMNVGHAGEPARWKDAFGREERAMRVS
jgi:hypothetical protein